MTALFGFELCPYSEDYLRLRARQGKLKAVKTNGEWKTKKEWVEEYLKSVEELNNKKHPRLAELAELRSSRVFRDTRAIEELKNEVEKLRESSLHLNE